MEAVQRAIREAKSAGWKPTERSVFLDPQFWRALSRARGWDADERACGAPPDVWTSRWARRWHDFVDHLALGKGIEDYFKRLEKKKPPSP